MGVSQTKVQNKEISPERGQHTYSLEMREDMISDNVCVCVCVFVCICMYMGVGLCVHMHVRISELCVYVASEQENSDRQVNKIQFRRPFKGKSFKSVMGRH